MMKHFATPRDKSEVTILQTFPIYGPNGCDKKACGEWGIANKK